MDFGAALNIALKIIDATLFLFKVVTTFLKGRVPRVPKKTLIVLPDRERQFWWHMGAVAGKPAMQIAGRFFFTNISDRGAIVLKTFMVGYYQKLGFLPLSKKAEGDVFVRHPDSRIYGTYEIPPDFTTEGSGGWWIVPPIKRQGKRLHGRICFIDQFGNEHWTQLLTWRSS